MLKWASLVAQMVKNLPAMQKTWVQSLGWEDPLEKGKATHSSILVQRIPWTVQSMGCKELDKTEQLSLSLFQKYREVQYLFFYYKGRIRFLRVQSDFDVGFKIKWVVVFFFCYIHPAFQCQINRLKASLLLYHPLGLRTQIRKE